jgi:hypothetical protein
MVQNYLKKIRKSCSETKAEIESALPENVTNFCSLWNKNKLGNMDYNNSYKEKLNISAAGCWSNLQPKELLNTSWGKLFT